MDTGSSRLLATRIGLKKENKIRLTSVIAVPL